MKKSLFDIKFEELREKTFEIILVVEMLCEVCEKPLDSRKKVLRKVQFLTVVDYQNLITRAKVYDRVEVDVENGKVYLYSHDFPGDVHKECIEKL